MLELRSLPSACAARRSESACDGCGARAYSVCAALDAADLARLDALADKGVFAPGQALAREGEPAETVFNIRSGSVRVFKLLPDGRRQITGFLFAGDFLGPNAEPLHAWSAEAIERTEVCRIRKADYLALVADCPDLERALFQRARHELAAARNQLLLLGRKTAQERIASFLLDLPGQDPMRQGPADHVRLPMTRHEIADYLGLTIETVSRVLTRLKTSGVIRLLSIHDLRIEQPRRLRALAEGWTPD